MNRLEKFLLLLSLVFALPSYGQLTDGLEYKVELQNTAGSGDNNPLWLNANKYGLSSIDTKNGYVRGALIRPLRVDSARRWASDMAWIWLFLIISPVILLYSRLMLRPVG